MKNSFAALCMSLSVTALATSLLTTVPAISQAPEKRRNWEYKIDGPMAEAVLNRHGNDGWELVAAASDVNGGPQLIFKRPK